MKNVCSNIYSNMHSNIYSKLQRTIVLVLTLMVSACAATYSKSEFSCAAPTGVSCVSISGLDANIDAGNLPRAQHLKPRESRDARDDSSETRQTIKTKTNIETADQIAPLRIPPKTLRVWIAPYQDEHGNLLDARRIYVQIHDGRWDINQKKQGIRMQYRTIELIKNKEESQKANPNQNTSQFQNSSDSNTGLVIKDIQ
jgi:conjugal transfer pilus assembly protein TraV